MARKKLIKERNTLMEKSLKRLGHKPTSLGPPKRSKGVTYPPLTRDVSPFYTWVTRLTPLLQPCRAKMGEKGMARKKMIKERNTLMEKSLKRLDHKHISLGPP